MVLNSELIFLAVQTPHHKKYEGVTRIPKTRKDFDYKYLISSIKSIIAIIKKNKNKKIHLTIISTVLPKPLMKKFYHLSNLIEKIYQLHIILFL